MKGIKIFFTILFLLNILTVNAQTKRLAVIGSSTAFGTGASILSESWVNRVKAYYTGLGLTINLNNLAAGSTNCYTGAPTGYTYTPQVGGGVYNYTPDPTKNINAAIAVSPDAIIVNYPSTNYDQFTTTEILACFQAIKDAATTAGITRCYIATTQPRTEFTSTARAKLKTLRDQMMTTFSPNVIDFYTDLAEPVSDTIALAYRYGDGIHLNSAGHQLLSQRVIAANVFGLTLPVKYEYFKAEKFGNKARIQWKTNLEDRNDYFTIERSLDGRTYETVSTVSTKGNGNASNQYAFMDQTPNAGLNFYRIKQTDIDGKFTYSSVAKLNFTSNGFDVSPVYPNPVTGNVKLNLSSNKLMPVEISIQDISGRIVKSEKLQILQGSRLYETSTEGLRPGMYSIKITAAGQSSTQTFIKSVH